MLLPYLDGERTPNLPTATGTLTGLTRAAMTPTNVARAAVEGMLCGMADGIDALRAQNVNVERVLLIGGAARSAAVQQLAPNILGAPVVVPDPAEFVAIGAARQAAWALANASGSTPGAKDGTDRTPPSWTVRTSQTWKPTGTSGEHIREAYRNARSQVHGI